MGLQEIQNERFENSEVMGKYWPKQDSEVLKGRVVIWRPHISLPTKNPDLILGFALRYWSYVLPPIR